METRGEWGREYKKKSRNSWVEKTKKKKEKKTTKKMVISKRTMEKKMGLFSTSQLGHNYEAFRPFFLHDFLEQCHN